MFVTCNMQINEVIDCCMAEYGVDAKQVDTSKINIEFVHFATTKLRGFKMNGIGYEVELEREFALDE